MMTQLKKVFLLFVSIQLLFAFGGCGTARRNHVPQLDTFFNSAEITPDGKFVAFSYKYKDLFYHVGLVTTDESPARLTPIKLPPSQDWLYPTFSADMKHFAVATYCGENPPYQCHEGISGYQIWRAGALDGTFERVSPLVKGVRRLKPIFGRKSGKIYYVASDANNTRLPATFVTNAPGRFETFVFPERLKKTFFGRTYNLCELQFSKDIDESSYLLLATLVNGPKELMRALKEKPYQYDRFLFEKQNWEFSLRLDHAVACFAASNTPGEYVYVKTALKQEPKRHRTGEIYLLSEDTQQLLNVFDGRILQISVSDDMQRIAFLGDYLGDRTRRDVWLYDVKTNSFKCLNVRDLIEKQLPILIEEDRLKHQNN